MNKSGKTQKTTYIKTDLSDAVDELMKKEERPYSYFLNEGLRMYLEQHEDRQFCGVCGVLIKKGDQTIDDLEVGISCIEHYLEKNNKK